MFFIVKVLLYDVIPCTDLKDFCARKQPSWIWMRMNVSKALIWVVLKWTCLGGKRMRTKKIKLHHTFALIYVQSNFNACMHT
jgi:hypothetical protein